ncbi:MAG TPA: hypothetical protein VES20_21055 [Bryobacteraceae bacterium]|nr:hypothetical protein [Bryobacteraceae bacterium]
MLFVAAVSMAMASDVQGTWSSEREVGDSDGKTYKHVSVITLKEESGVLTGSVVATSEAPWMRENTGKAVDIQDGKVDGNKFTFKLVQEASNGVRTAAYEGTVTGDQMKGVIKFRGIGQSWVFDAKRIEPASR